MAEKNKKTKSSKKPSITSAVFRKFAIFLNIIAVFVLGLSYLAAFIPPDRGWFFAFFGFLYPVFLAANVFFVLFWAVFLRKAFFISVIAIALGYSFFASNIQFGHAKSRKPTGDITLMSYNVRQFDVYNWSNTKPSAMRNQIFELISGENPDVLCLQDYYQGDGVKNNNTEALAKRNGFDYQFVSLIKKGNRTSNFGLATFSKYPIVYSERVDFSNSLADYCLITDIVVKTDTIRVLNTHLKSLHFGKDDYQFVSEIGNNNVQNTKMSGFRTIVSKMKKGFQYRAPQVRTLKQVISQSPYRVILCGDFNDTPTSYAYQQIRKKLNDSFVLAGKGFGKTYTEFLLPVRIDYIFLDKSMNVTNFKIIPKAYSDHYPLVAKIDFR